MSRLAAFLTGAAAALAVVPSTAAAAPIRISTSTSAITDAVGQKWSADTGATGGRLTKSGKKVSGTATPALYQTSRTGMSAYSVPVPSAGTYAVDLYLAETGGASAGQRVFSVAAEGATVASNVDVAAAVGQYAPYHVVFTTPVTDGRLSLSFSASRGEAMVSAIEVSPMSSATGPLALSFSDDFSGPAGASPSTANWAFDTGAGSIPGWGNNELQTYTSRPQNVALDGAGDLAITARRETYTGADGLTRSYTSGRINTLGKVSYTYGRIEARVQMPAGQGLLPAFWGRGNDVTTVGWPKCGETDFSEVLGSDMSTVHGTIHGPTSSGSAWQAGFAAPSATSLAQFHTYASLVVPGAVQMQLDGRPYVTYTPADLGAAKPWVFDHPFHLLLDVAVGGNWPGSPDSTTPFPATMLVDYVKIWS